MPSHVTHHVLTGLAIALFMIAASIFAVYALRIGNYTASSPAGQPEIEQPVAVIVKPEPEVPVILPAPIFKHDYAIPPVVDGIPPVITNFKTEDPVVFLTIDDGGYKDPSVVKLLKDNNLKASLFLAKSFIWRNTEVFKEIVSNGALVENHTLSHDLGMVKTMTYDQQKNEICGMSDYIEREFGRRPIFFRPPGGAYTATMIQAAGACGMRAVVTWIATVNNGTLQYQIGDRLRPGDIVLMHFRPEFALDIQGFVNAMNASGLHTELLEDWIN